ncbi:hypothetical protein WR25_24742 isoform B [Diploscapter pachys]|nr:hypothetical protein WR25_24742 isoform B [Diploscapter pachys]
MQVGFVPSNYVKKEESLLDKAKGTFRGLAKTRPNVDNLQFPSDSLASPSAHSNNNHSPAQSSSSFTKMSSRTMAMVKFSYDPRLDDELQLAKGETITVIEKSTDGWWKGEKDGVSGWFPSNYVEESDSAAGTGNANGGFASLGSALAAAGQSQQPPQPASTNPSNKHKLETVVALYSFEASSPEELSFRKGEALDVIDHPPHDPDWWLARNNKNAEGLIPRNYIEVISNGSSASAPAPAPAPAPVPIAPSWSQPASADPTGGMSSEPWYFGRISRDEADRLLNSGREGEFLVRDSESNPGDLSISMRGVERNKHFKVQTVDGQLRIGTRSFPTMHALIAHYRSHPIFSSANEKLYLTSPLPR